MNIAHVGMTNFVAARPRAASSSQGDGFAPGNGPSPTPTAAQIRELFAQPKESLRELEVWRAKIPKGNNTPPAFTEKGDLVIQTEKGLTVLNPKGEKIGETELEGLSRYAVPLRDAEGNVFLSTREGMARVQPDGSLGWHKPFGSAEVAPVFGPEGTLYHGNYSGELRRIDPEGNVLWTRHVNPEARYTHINWGMVSLPTGEVVANEDPGVVHCFDQEGEHQWTLFKDRTNCSRLSTTPEGEILITTKSSGLACYTREGELSWHYDAHEGRRLEPGEEAGSWGNTLLSSRAVVSPDGKSIYVAGMSGQMTALDREGNPRWTRDMGFWTKDEGVKVGENGTVYMCDSSGGVHALDPESGETMWSFHAGGHQSYTNIATRGDLVYLLTAEGDVHALSENALQHRMDIAQERPEDKSAMQIELGQSRVVIGGSWLKTRKKS